MRRRILGRFGLLFHVCSRTALSGMLTNKYWAEGEAPPAVDDPSRERTKASLQSPRGRMDTMGWGSTLYRYLSLLTL